MHRRTSCNTATTKKSADRQAHQEPSNAGTLVIAQAHTAVEDIKGQQVVNTVTERLLEAPITLTQSELHALVPNVWAQAVSTTECEREEPIALAMLGEVFSNQYKLEAPVTTARGPRIARIADKYAATTLALSQPSALPLYQPFPSNPSHPEPSELEPRPSAPASTTCAEQSQHVTVAETVAEDIHDRYEYISCDQVESQPPRQAADEPEVTTQPAAIKASREGAYEVAPPPILPLPTPFITRTAAEVAERPLPSITPAVAAQATQSQAIATEATVSFVAAEVTPSFFVAAEAPQSFIAAAQQQSAPLSFPFPPWRSPFQLFSSLLTIYHRRIPNINFPRCSLQPPQCRLPSEPPPPSTTAPHESNNPRAVIQEVHLDTSSPSSPTRLTSPRYHAPYATASEERFSAARSSVVNATSHNKRDSMSLREDYMCSPSLASSTTLHVSARLMTRHRHAHNPEGNPYKAMQRAGTCTTTRGHDFHLTSPSLQYSTPTFLQTTALARSPSNSALVCPNTSSAPRSVRYNPISVLPVAHSGRECKRRSNKQGNFSDDDENFAPFSTLTPLDEKFPASRCSLGNASNQSNEGAMNFEIGYKDSSSLAPPIMPHASAVLETLLPFAHGPGGHSYHVTKRAEACTASRDQHSPPIPSSTAQPPIPFLQNSAYARTLNDQVSACLKPWTVLLSSYKARRNVLDHHRARLATDPLKSKNSLLLTFPTVPHASAALVTRLGYVLCLFRHPYRITKRAETRTTTCSQESHPNPSSKEQLTSTTLHPSADFKTRPQRAPSPDNDSYQATRHATTCTTDRAPDRLLIPFRVEPLIPTVPQSAAPFRALGNLVPTCIRPRLPRKSSFAACKDVHDCSRSQSAPQLFKQNSRSGRDDEGELRALSWEEIPSSARTPHPSRLLSPRLRTFTNPMLRTAFFFSWEENRGNVQPSERCIITLTATPSKHRSSEEDDFSEDDDDFRPTSTLTALDERFSVPKHYPGNTTSRSKRDSISLREDYSCSPFLALSTAPHAFAGFKIQSQRVPRLDRYPYLITRRAETCMTARARHFSFIPSSGDQLPLPFPPNAELACGLSNQVSTYPSLPKYPLSSYEARGAVPDRSRSQTVPYPLRLKNITSLVFSTVPHRPALLAALPRRIPHQDRFVYQVMQRAETCTIARAQEFDCLPQSEEQVTTTFLKAAALASGLSDSVPTYLKSRLIVPLHFAAYRSVHDRSRAWPAINTLRVKINLVQASLKMLHTSASLETELRCFSYFDRSPYQVTSRAEACTAARAQDRRFIPQQVKLVTLTLLQNAAPVRDLSISPSTYPILGLLVLSSFTACGSVHDRLCAWPAFYLLRLENNIVQVSLRVPHSRAVLAIRLQHAPGPDSDHYKVTSRAEPCMATRVQDYYFSPQQVKLLAQTFPQNAALVCGPSGFTTTRSRPVQPRLLSYATRKDMHDRSHAQIVLNLLRVEASTSSPFVSVPHVAAPLATRPQRGLRLESRLYPIPWRAETCLAISVHVWYLPSSSLEQFSRTLPQSAAPARGLFYLDSMSRQYRQVPSRTVALRGDMRGSSRWSALSDQQRALQFRIVLLVRRSSGSSLRLERTEDSPDLSWEEMMRRRCGSMRGNALSSDLEPGARRRGVAARQAGGVATRVPQPQPHTLNSTHTHLASIARPRHLIRSPSNSARVSSICGT